MLQVGDIVRFTNESIKASGIPIFARRTRGFRNRRGRQVLMEVIEVKQPMWGLGYNWRSKTFNSIVVVKPLRGKFDFGRLVDDNTLRLSIGHLRFVRRPIKEHRDSSEFRCG